jgi:hypothetical protein
MSQSDDPLALLLTQSDIPPEICAHLMLLLHQTLACTIELRSRVEQISWHVKGTDVAPLYALLDAYTDLATERLAVLGGVAARPARVLMPAAAGSAAHVAEAIRGRLLRDLAFQDSCLTVQSASPRRRPWLKHPVYP